MLQILQASEETTFVCVDLYSHPRISSVQHACSSLMHTTHSRHDLEHSDKNQMGRMVEQESDFSLWPTQTSW